MEIFDILLFSSLTSLTVTVTYVVYELSRVSPLSWRPCLCVSLSFYIISVLFLSFSESQVPSGYHRGLQPGPQHPII